MKSSNHLIALTIILSLLFSACGASLTPQPTMPTTEPSATDTAILPTETSIPSSTPDVRPRLLTTDNGAVLRPEIEINNTNFQQVMLLGTLGTGTPVVVQFSPDDTLLAVGTSVGVVYIYDAHTFELRQSIQTNLPFQFPTYFTAFTICDPCGRVAISPDNKLLGILSFMGEIEIWDLVSMQKIASSTEKYINDMMQKRLEGGDTRLQGWRYLQFSDDSKYLGIFSETIWWPPGYCQFSSEKCKDYFKEPWFVLSVSGSVWCGNEFICPISGSAEIHHDFSQFTDAFTFAPENPSIPLLPLPKTINGKTHFRGESYIKPQFISSDGNRALSYDYYGVLNNFPRYGNSEIVLAGTLWDVADKKVINSFSFPYVDIYALSHDMNTIAYMTPKGIAMLDLLSGTNRGEISLATCLGKLIFSPDGSILAGYFRNVIYFCDPFTGNVIRAITVPTGFISSIAFSPDGKFVASTGQTWGNYLSTSKKNYDPFVYIWNVSDGKLVSTLEHHGDTMIIKFSPDGKYVATGAGIDSAGPGVALPNDHRFILWSWDGQKATKLTEQEFDFGIGNLTFSPNSQQILLATTGAPYYRQPPRMYLYDIASDMLSKSFYEQTGCNDPPDLLQFFITGKQFLLGDRCAARKVSISTDVSNPGFPLANRDLTFPDVEYGRLSASPNLLVMVFFANQKPNGHRVKISDINYTTHTSVQSDYNYMSLVFSTDGKVIYGEANILGVISIFGIPTEK